MKGYKDCNICGESGEVEVLVDSYYTTIIETKRIDCPICLKKHYKEIIAKLKGKGVDSKMLIKKGQVIIVTDGVYDDYRIEGIYRVLKEFDMDGILGKMHSYFKLQGSDKYSDSEIFIDHAGKVYYSCYIKIKWLKDNGYIKKETDFVELNLNW